MIIYFHRVYSYLLYLRRICKHIAIISIITLESSCGFSGYSRLAIPDLNSLENITHVELLDITNDIGSKYQSNPKNKVIGIAYADALRRIGRYSQAVAVMQQIAILYPNDTEVLSAYSKALANSGHLEEALDSVERAQRPDMPDWTLISAKASILSQMGKYLEARTEYNKALEIAPNEPSIVSNIAMSYLLTGDIKMAEEKMRYASRMLGADSRIRQNLALVIGLQGRIKEAYDIASQELDPEEAKENIAYLKSILSQKDPWSRIRSREYRSSNTSQKTTDK
ncbi:tetratricopeptide repeat protein [Candidatus Liberibacter americanus]|uniref:Flp pilus assembly protein TadD n=1 Tax=Candidatus Liberibacter americanus str. Sao Paulo TaxID=1261131 RepID=U6B5L8_9HYPH|nr:tetratricopeptide repeat protein [Candidatus Liberibacter americanus]AHA28340.1 Flp pilus assembly protein TadD [Candidatus Liberibacter americanus str. Sao Paulo]EMS36630.1 TPR repeat-containing protein [Candidatus Liberibacter americanus PW_SP]